MASRSTKVWVVRYVDSQGAGDPRVYLTDKQAALSTAELLNDILGDVEREFTEDLDEDLFKAVAEIRDLLKEGKIWEAYADWQSLDEEYEMARNLGTVQVEEGRLHYGPLEWLPS